MLGDSFKLLTPMVVCIKKTTWAGRSGVDRYLGKVEASGSIPDQSIINFLDFVIRGIDKAA